MHVLLEDPIMRSFDQIQHVIIMDLDLVQSYLNMTFAKPIISSC